MYRLPIPDIPDDDDPEGDVPVPAPCNTGMQKLLLSNPQHFYFLRKLTLKGDHVLRVASGCGRCGRRMKGFRD
ncbi:unnamed protein product [Arctogadus glacialis]